MPSPVPIQNLKTLLSLSGDDYLAVVDHGPAPQVKRVSWSTILSYVPRLVNPPSQTTDPGQAGDLAPAEGGFWYHDGTTWTFYQALSGAQAYEVPYQFSRAVDWTQTGPIDVGLPSDLFMVREVTLYSEQTPTGLEYELGSALDGDLIGSGEAFTQSRTHAGHWVLDGEVLRLNRTVAGSVGTGGRIVVQGVDLRGSVPNLALSQTNLQVGIGSAPASETSAGQFGTRIYDPNTPGYVYECVVGGTEGNAQWIRTTVTTF